MEVQLQAKFPQLGVLDAVINTYAVLLAILTSPPPIGVMPFSLPPEISKRFLFTQPHQHRGLPIFGIFTNLISEKLNLVFKAMKIWFLFSLNLLFSICSVDVCFGEPTRPEITRPRRISVLSHVTLHQATPLPPLSLCSSDNGLPSVPQTRALYQSRSPEKQHQ